jgi:uncharacterized cupin superfamily protein
VSGPVANALSVKLESDPNDPPGYRSPARRMGPLIGGARIGASVYELGPEQSICPYHYEVGDEEWLLVIVGRPTLRDPDGEAVLVPGDLVCFPSGPAGAHKLTNDTEATVRLMIFSTKNEPSIAFYPDSGKIGVWPPGKLFREADAVDYWDGELET